MRLMLEGFFKMTLKNVSSDHNRKKLHKWLEHMWAVPYTSNHLWFMIFGYIINKLCLGYTSPFVRMISLHPTPHAVLKTAPRLLGSLMLSHITVIGNALGGS